MTKQDVERLLPGTKILIDGELSSDYVSSLEPFLGRVVTVRKVDLKPERARVYFEEYIGTDAYFYPDEIVEIVCAQELDADRLFEPADISLLLNTGGPYA